MENHFVLLVGIFIISGAFCFPSGENGKPAVEAVSGATTTVNLKPLLASPASTTSSIVGDVVAANGSVTLSPDPKSTGLSNANTTIAPTNDTTTTPSTPLTSPTTTTPTTPPTTTTISTTSTIVPTTTVKTTTASPATTPVIPSSTPSTPAPAPSHDSHFDGASFIGGILISLATMSLIFAVIKVYRSRTERNYHTL